MERLPERVVTDRLEIRRWVVGDAPALDASVRASLDHLLPWMAWASLEPQTVPDRVALIEEWAQDWQSGGDVVLGVFIDGTVVGGTGLHRRLGPNALEIGYWVDVAHVRQGIATEVARVLTSAAFALPGIERVEIHHDKANQQSGRVPARLGFAFGGEQPDEISAAGETGVNCRWVMTKEVWAGT